MPTRVTWIGTTADGGSHAVDDLPACRVDRKVTARGTGATVDLTVTCTVT